MIENRKYSTRLLLVALVFLTSFSGVKAEVFQWIGGSGQWSDVDHWNVNGQTVSTLPSSGDDVFVLASQNLEIELDIPTHISSLTVSGNENLTIHASANYTIQIDGSVYLTDQTTLAGNVKIELLGTADVAFKHFSQTSQSRILETGNGYEELMAAGGGCPFFTLVANPTAPTCNGTNDGIAEVLEPVDGVGPFTYQWIGGPETAQWPNVGAGTYTVIVIDVGQGGLPCNTDVFVNEPGPLTVFAMNANPPLCADVCNGTALPIVIGGNGGYTYTWSSGEFGISASSLCPVFNLVVEDQLGCVLDTTYTYPNPPDTIKFIPVVTHIDCFGNDNGAIDMSITGGVPPFVVSWIGPNGFASGSEDISGLEPGDYVISVEDANACLADSLFTISENPVLEATAVIVDNQCGGGFLGEIDLTPTGGLPPYDFDWVGPNGFTSTDQNLAGLESGPYQVTITDAALCTHLLNVDVDEPVEITIVLTSIDLSCFEDFSGEATATAAGGTPGYSYDWTGPNGFVSTGTAITNLEVGMYYVTAMDVNTCAKLDSIEIFEPESLLAELTETPITCNNGNDGAIDLNIVGGTPAYSVSWTGPNGFTSADEDISNLEPGQYNVVVTDANLCVISASIELLNPEVIGLSADITLGTCASSNNGSIDLIVTGGTAPFTFSWTGPNGFTSMDEDISGLEPGTYAVDVSDANICLANESFELLAPADLQVDFDVTHILCFGDNTGEILSTPNGGVAPYSFIWIGPGGFISVDQNNSNLIAGIYDLAMTDGNGCLGLFSVTVLQEPEIIIDETIVDVTCFGFNDGSIDINVSGGNPPYVFSWQGPNGFASIQQNISDLLAGTYDLEVTDAFDCIVPVSYDVIEPGEIIVDETVTDVLCAGDSNGSIEIIVNGGTAPFDFSWSGPSGYTSTDQDIFGLVGGSYDLVIDDANGCQYFASYVVGETFFLGDAIVIQDVSCFGLSDGELTLTVIGGTEPYIVTWTGPNGFVGAGLSLVSLESGTYTATIQDDNGCTIERDYLVGTPDELFVTITHSQITCHGDNDGTATATPTGGSAPYGISWTGPNGFTSASASISSLEEGTYIVTVEDGSLCAVIDSVEIINPLELLLDVDVVQPSCTADDGTLAAIVSGGTIAADYTYSWLDEIGTEISTLASISDLAPGTYTIIVMDDNGCSIQQEIELFRDSFDLTESVFDVSCIGAVDGAIDVTTNGGTPGFDFSWTGPNGFVSIDQNLSALEAGDYTVSVIDQTGCVFNATYTISEPPPIDFAFTTVPESCPGDANGSIALTVSGGTPGYIVNWTGPNGFVGNGLNISGLEPGLYTATATDIRGCTNFTEILVGVGAVFTIDGITSDPLCVADFTGAIDISMTEVAGVSTPFAFSWTGPNGFTSVDEDLINLEEGIYTVIVTGATGCDETETFELSDPLALTLSTTFVNSNCQQADGSANAVGGGGTGNIAYSWANALDVEVSNTADLADAVAGTYTVTISDENGCSLSESVQISDQNGSVSGIVVNPTCNDGSDGAIDITVDGGAEPLTFEWTDESGVISDQEDLVDLSLGVYSIAVTDANGCLFAAVFEITNPVPIVGTPTVVPVSCAGNDGSINLFVTDGMPPYQIDWTGPNGYVGTGTIITDLEVGIYEYTITDANICTAMGSVDLEQILDIVVLPAQTDVLCGGDFTGAIDLNVSGGSAPYTFAWTGPNGFISDQQNIAGLEVGIYDLVVTDNLGCAISDQYEITENPAIQSSFAIVQPDCNLSNGSIAATVSGGIVAGDYFINWSSSNGNPLPQDLTINNLDVGSYTLFVSDDNGCAYDTTIVLSNPGSNITSLIGHLTCYTETEGSIQLFVVDVQAPYDVAWTGPDGFVSANENIFSLASGLYTYEVTGADGCVYIETLEVLSPQPIEAPAIVQGTCFGENNGAISVNISGGIDPYTIGWIGPDGFISVETELVDLAPGVYNLQVLDANTCLFEAAYEVIENPEIIVAETLVHVTCNSATTGNIDLAISGGTAQYSFEWSGPNGFVSADQSIGNLAAGIYAVLVTDDAGCVVSANYEISQPEAVAIESEMTPVGCETPGSLGSIDLEIEGGVPDYDVVWSGPNGFVSTDEDISDLESGVYTYQVTDANGCSSTDQIEVLQVAPILIDLIVNDISCNGEVDGSISATVSGGTPDYTAVWTGPNGFTSDQLELSDLEAGNYSLEITDELGCSAIESVEIIEPEALIASNLVVVDASCNTIEDGSISVDLSGGTEPLTILWTGPNGFTSDQLNIDQLAIGDYVLEVSDANGCTTGGAATIDTPFEVFADAGDDLQICQDVQPTLVIGSGSNADTFVWTNLEGDTISFDATLTIEEEPGTYMYVLLASNDLCGNADTLVAEILQSPEVDAGLDFEVFAEEEFILGGDPTSPTAISFAWSPDQNTGMDTTLANPSGYILETTEFSVLVTDVNGCQNIDTVLVTLIPDINISSGITPNGDGVNDTWIIDNMELFPNSIVNVFSRWGIVLYEVNGYNASNAWDGTYKGDDLPVGTYYYTIELNDERFPKPLTGPITIYR